MICSLVMVWKVGVKGTFILNLTPDLMAYSAESRKKRIHLEKYKNCSKNSAI